MSELVDDSTLAETEDAATWRILVRSFWTLVFGEGAARVFGLAAVLLLARRPRPHRPGPGGRRDGLRRARRARLRRGHRDADGAQRRPRAGALPGARREDPRPAARPVGGLHRRVRRDRLRVRELGLRPRRLPPLRAGAPGDRPQPALDRARRARRAGRGRRQHRRARCLPARRAGPGRPRRRRHGRPVCVCPGRACLRARHLRGRRPPVRPAPAPESISRSGARPCARASR